jgi:hypothetical protein
MVTTAYLKERREKNHKIYLYEKQVTVLDVGYDRKGVLRTGTGY